MSMRFKKYLKKYLTDVIIYINYKTKRGTSMEIGYEVAKSAFHIIKYSYRKYIDEPFNYMMQIHNQIQGMLNSIQCVNVDHTNTVNEIRKQIQAELTYRIASFDVNFYNRFYARKEFADASRNFLNVINKMLELADVPVIDITKNSFLTVLENREYFVAYGEGKLSFMQKIDVLIAYYRREIDAKWQEVCRAKVNIDNI